MNRITLSELQDNEKAYQEAYDKGLTIQECTACGRPVVEKNAIWTFYPGSGEIYHPGICVQQGLMMFHARTWLKLALDDYLKLVADRFIHSEWRDGLGWVEVSTQSYRELREKNAREYPDDSFYTRPMETPRYEYYMDMFQMAIGVPVMEKGFSLWNPDYNKTDEEVEED
jgi:hypothetical protein